MSRVYLPLKNLAAHGKTRSRGRKLVGATTRRRTEAICTFLQRDIFLIQKRYFICFYVFGIVHLLILASFLSTEPRRAAGDHRAAFDVLERPTIAVIALHLIRRVYECIFVHQWKFDSKMHVSAFLLGMFHYFLLPLVFVEVPSCWREASTSDDAVLGGERLSQSTQWRPMTILVFGFCMWAQYQQYRHHALLALFRSSSSYSEAATCHGVGIYALPRGGWFQLVSCPHYLAEILIYLSLTILTELERQPNNDNSFLSWLLLLWVTVNLSVSALESHAWYEQRFPDYSKLGRRAIIPFTL